MNILAEVHKKILKELTENKVEFILIGGYAVVYHGYVRTTGDLDIWIKPDNNNKLKLIATLKQHGIINEDLEKIKALNFTTVIAFHVGVEPTKIDFISKISNIDFDSASKNAAYFPMQNFQIPILNLNDLILSKISTNRPKDKADIDELQKIHRMKNKTNSTSFWKKLFNK